MKGYTVEEIAELWKENKRGFIKYSSYSTYSNLIDNQILPTFGKMAVIPEKTVQEYILRKFNDEGLSLNSVRGAVIVLKMILRYGASLGLCEKPEWTLRYPLPRSAKKMEVFSKKDMQKMLTAIKNNPTPKNLGIYISLATGLRIGEVCALQWRDLDMRSGILHVTKTVERIYIKEGGESYTSITVGPPKTFNSIRDIPFSNELAKVLGQESQGKKPQNYILSDGPKPIEPRSYRNYFGSFLISNKIPVLKFHALRHSFATRCIQAGADYKTVSSILGHANIKITLDMYVHPGMESKKKCVNLLIKEYN